MLGRRAAARRNKLFRDRGEAQIPLSPPAAPDRFQNAIPFVQPIAIDSNVSTTFVWPDPQHQRSSVVLVASFDAYLHHRMRPTLSHPRNFTLTLRVPPGSHTYKFLVDGVWSTCLALRDQHPIETTDDGVKHHRLVVQAPNRSQRNGNPQIATARLHNSVGDPRSTAVFRSASSSAVPPIQQRADPTLPPNAFQPQTSSVSHQDTGRHKVDVAPRGSSFTSPPPVGGISHMKAITRKSLLQRVGSGWLRRFSGRVDADGEFGCSFSMSQTQFLTRDRSGSGLFRGSRDRVSLFPSASEPSVGRCAHDEKENSFSASRFNTFGNGNDRGHSKRQTFRGSNRGTAVKISRPTRVNEPKDMDEVNRQADNWRQMARHLQDDLCDPTGARELFTKAIQHRERHGLWCTSQNAQVHVDLARNLSKGDRMKDAELHLRLALRIYNDIDAGKEHIADLMLYVGVVVDRQKRRAEAEELYRKALNMYKEHSIMGNNVEIAVKNLSLNLRKQNREHEIEAVRVEYGSVKPAPVSIRA
ncbi:AMP-activated protein kinase [Gracilaria domingensis]|nr:AMP-activated protein kinase [Gracilaria domingensis]